MATYTKSTNSYDGRYYKITLTQGSYNSDTGLVNVDWVFEVLGGNSNYYSAPATSVIAISSVDSSQTTIYSHPKTMYPGSGTASFPIAKGSQSGTSQFYTDSDGNLTLQIKFHKDAMEYSSTWSAFDSTENFVLDQIPRQSLRLRVNGEWKRVTPYIRVNGEWKRATAYTRVSGTWKRGG